MREITKKGGPFAYAFERENEKTPEHSPAGFSAFVPWCLGG
jgi:hypothetical protein